MYAVFLEHLLANLRSLLIPDEEQRSVWRTVVLWLNFPSLMWSKQREQLRRAAENGLSELEDVAYGADIELRASSEPVEDAEQKKNNPALKSSTDSSVRRSSRGRGPGPKRVAFENALTNQVRCGDLRLFSADERERNAAAYDAAASLPAPLSRGTARRYVVQALPRLEGVGAAGDPLKVDAVSGPSR
jgi:hypothetical protein